MNRRRFLKTLGVSLTAMATHGYTPYRHAYAPERFRPALERVQRACFEHFWRYGHDDTSFQRAGMVTDTSVMRLPALTVGGSGFGVMATLVGAERGWVTREAARIRVAAVVHFLDKAERFHGAWSHWIDREGRALRFGRQIKAGDLVETSFMVMGLMCAQRYFDRNTSEECALREAIDRLCHAVEWDFYVQGPDLFWLWESTTDKRSLPLRAYNEALITYLLALGAPTHAIPPACYHTGWLRGGAAIHPERTWYGHPFPLGGADRGGPLFLSHYSFLGLNPRTIQDDATDYFLLGLRHTLINRHYCLREAPTSHAYDTHNWGLSACAGPGKRPYAARCPRRDDGVVAPTAALSSIVYAPFYAAQVLLRVANDPCLMTPGGPVDAYVPATGEVTPGRIAIDQGPIVIMIENYRSGLLWRLFMSHPDIRQGLVRAGMRPPRHPTGFPYALPGEDGVHDLLRHPDHNCYELDYSLATGANVSFTLARSEDPAGQTFRMGARTEGMHRLTFPAPPDFIPGEEGTLTLLLDEVPTSSVRLRFH